MSSRFRVVCAAGAVLLAIAAVVVLPARAQAAEAEVWAFLFADQPTARSYEPANQAASATTIRGEVRRTGTGAYTVTVRAASVTGVPVVSPVSTSAVHCQVAAFGPTGSAQEVRVRCFSGDRPADSRFTLSFVSSSGQDSGDTGAYGYVFNDRPTLATYTNPRHYNSAGGPVEIYRDAASGAWTVRFFGQAFNNNGGNVQVTAVGGLPSRCSVVRWSPNTLGADAQVRCDRVGSTPGAVPQWTLLYAHERALVGDRSGTFGYVQATQPSGPTYTPPPPRNLGPDGLVHRVTPTTVGRYQVEVHGLTPPPTTLHVSVNGDTDDYCVVVGTTPLPGNAPSMLVDIGCFTKSGAPNNNVFSLIYYSSR